jgi:hypothetical protein
MPTLPAYYTVHVHTDAPVAKTIHEFDSLDKARQFAAIALKRSDVVKALVLRARKPNLSVWSASSKHPFHIDGDGTIVTVAEAARLANI